MEQTLRQNLLRLLELYQTRVSVADSTAGQRAVGDWRFFSRLRVGGSFTARRYDAAVEWFFDHWPEDLEWPDSIDAGSRN